MSHNIIEHPSGITEVVFSRPPVNAHAITALSELASVLAAIETRITTSVVLLRSDGRGFSAGGDMKEMMDLPGHEGIIGQAREGMRASVAIAECAVPVIAAVHGYCMGVGVLLAGAADIVVAAEDASFTLAEIDFGATAGAIQAVGLMPERRLRTAMYTAEPVMAAELATYGTIHSLVPAANLQATALDLAARIAAKDPRSVRAMKASIDGSVARRIRDLYRAEISHTYELNMLGIAAAARARFLAN